MASTKSPTGLAAATKVIVDAVQTTFGAAVVVLFFFGVALVSLTAGLGNLGPELRGSLIEKLMWAMCGVLAVLLVLRLVRPSGLSGPPTPSTQHVQIRNSRVE
jgi:hypothetical protein